MYVHIRERKIQCSKCGSQNIVKPANEENWIYKCLDCGHKKKKEKVITTAGRGESTKEDLDKPIEF